MHSSQRNMLQFSSGTTSGTTIASRGQVSSVLGQTEHVGGREWGYVGQKPLQSDMVHGRAPECEHARQLVRSRQVYARSCREEVTLPRRTYFSVGQPGVCPRLFHPVAWKAFLSSRALTSRSYGGLASKEFNRAIATSCRVKGNAVCVSARMFSMTSRSQRPVPSMSYSLNRASKFPPNLCNAGHRPRAYKYTESAITCMAGQNRNHKEETHRKHTP